MTHPLLILASASPRRAELLRELGMSFEVIPADVPEADHEQLTAAELCQINAYRKARVIAKRFPAAVVLGADTLVTLGTTTFAKPTNLADAQRMLWQLQGRTHTVVTGVCLLHLAAHRCRIFAEQTAVTFRQLDAMQIDEYLRRINPLDKAGAYAIQEHGAMIVKSISGSYSNVVGLPVERVQPILESWGV